MELAYCRCSAAALSTGSCLPGVYSLRYSLFSGPWAVLTVIVEQLTVATFNYTFVPDAPNTSSIHSAAVAFVLSLADSKNAAANAKLTVLAQV